MEKRPMALINTGDTTVDKVWAHYKDPSRYKLTPNQEGVKDRWIAIWALLLKKKNRTKAVNTHKDIFGISVSQAWKDVRNAEKLFGNIMRADRDGRSALLYEFAFDSYKKAQKAGDFKAAKGFFTEMRELLGKEETVHFNPEKLEYREIKIGAPKLVINRLVAKMSEGVMDFNKVVDAEAIILRND